MFDSVKSYFVPLFLALLVLSGINIYRWFPAWTAKYFSGHEDEDSEKMREKVQEETLETSQRVYAALKTMLRAAIIGDAPLLESTQARRDRYLRDNDYNVKQAVLSLVEKRHGISESSKSWLLRTIPFAGLPLSLVRTLWHQLRDTALIAGSRLFIIQFELIHNARSTLWTQP